MDLFAEPVPDAVPKNPGLGCGCIGAIVCLGSLVFGGCCLIPSMLNDFFFVDRVNLEQMGWRFEAEYEGFQGVSANYERLSYNGKSLGQPVPRSCHLMTPIGEFYTNGVGWSAAWSDPQIWADDYQPPGITEGEPWVTQIDHSRNISEFLDQGFYQAPADASSYGVPWTKQQLKGTPAHWVYVYRLSWPDPSHTEYESHAVTGYWVDRAHLDKLKWE